MSKSLLVSLISDQTMPNVKMIKELKKLSPDYLFISTIKMEEKCSSKWIETASKVTAKETIVIDENSINDAVEKLSAFDYSEYDRILVNLTGGTKMMALGVYKFFVAKNAEFYYITSSGNEYLALNSKNPQCQFSERITVAEYLSAHGFSLPSKTVSSFDLKVVEKIFDKYCQLEEDFELNGTYFQAWETLRKCRSKKKINSNQMDVVRPLLSALDYKPDSNLLSVEDIKLLSGEWLELYVGLTIKKELNLTDEEILIGQNIEKVVPTKKSTNVISSMLDFVETDELPNKNEIDVMFVYNNQFYTIECKTSIVSDRIEESATGMKKKPYSILGETIYKADSIKSKFGLFAKASILTLTTFNSYANSRNDGNIRNSLKGQIGRANLSNIKIIDRKMLLDSPSISSLIL